MLFISKSENLRFGVDAGKDTFAFDPETARKERITVRTPIVIEFKRQWITSDRQLIDALNFFYPLRDGTMRSPLNNETVLPELQGGIIDGSVSTEGIYEGSDPKARFSGYDTDNKLCCPPELKAQAEAALLASEHLGHYYFQWTSRILEELLPWPGYVEIGGPGGANEIEKLVPVVAGGDERKQLELWQKIRQYESNRPKLRPSFIERASANEERLAGPQELKAALGVSTLAEQIVAASQGIDEDETSEQTAAEGRYGEGHPDAEKAGV